MSFATSLDAMPSDLILNTATLIALVQYLLVASDPSKRLSVGSISIRCDGAWMKEDLGKFKQYIDDGMAP